MNPMMFPKMLTSHAEGWDWLMRIHPSVARMYLAYVVPMSIIPPAMLFYERLGGRRAGGFTDPGPLWPSDNIVFVWDELSALIGDGQY